MNIITVLYYFLKFALRDRKLKVILACQILTCKNLTCKIFCKNLTSKKLHSCSVALKFSTCQNPIFHLKLC